MYKQFCIASELTGFAVKLHNSQTLKFSKVTQIFRGSVATDLWRGC